MQVHKRLDLFQTSSVSSYSDSNIGNICKENIVSFTSTKLTAFNEGELGYNSDMTAKLE